VRGAGQQHRLNSDSHKWQPLGIGDGQPVTDTPAADNGSAVPVIHTETEK
jgi:hypothetical protein